MVRSIIFLLSFIIGTSLAGQETLSGKVVDQGQTPIIGAYILLLNQKIHTHSNAFGEFSIDGIRRGDTLQISSVGFKTQLLPITNLQEKLKIKLADENYRINEVVISQDINAIHQISKIDLIKNPVVSSQEVLRSVPGLFIGQHAGGGKAEQIFLRGFDIDHGTDIAISVEGMPVNMVSHAHGQGYADLHFIIPETIEDIDYNKGPYYADKGNLNTAGYIDFRLKNKAKENLLGIEFGNFNSRRFSGILSLLSTEKTDIYVAGEYLQTDGPFESSQNFDRVNIMTRLHTTLDDNSTLTATLSHFSSEWDASGQIPVRSVAAGDITRFGAIDDTEGGQTSRSNVMLSYLKGLSENTYIKSNLYYSRYEFELYSNFTFFLRNPEVGDQIVQREKRDLFGFNSEINHSTTLAGRPALLQGGIGLRNDEVRDNELSDSQNRQTIIRRRQFGDVKEVNYFAYAMLEWDFGNLTINPGLRFDQFQYEYYDRLATLYDPLSDDATVITPKLNLLYNLNRNAQIFVKTGIGFHSNDTRVVLQSDTDEGFAPKAYGVDVGTIWKPTERLLANVALWYLDSEQEFVYVGDEGIVEPSGRSLRYGVDLSMRYQATDWLYLTTDWTYTNPRSADEPEGADYIPLAPIWTGTAGLNITKDALDIGLQMRYLGDRPANEDYSITAKGYTVLDANVSYRWKALTFNLNLDNVLDVEWEETQFATESRLFNEVESTEEIHFTPGTPRFLRASVQYRF